MDILMAYSSGYGATREIAERIATILCQDRSLHIHVKKIDKIRDISAYDTIIIGGSIRANEITANVRDFISKHQNVLAQKNTVFFASSIRAYNPNMRECVKNEIIMPFFAQYPQIHLLDISAFGGKIDMNRFNSVLRSYLETLLKQYDLPIKPVVDTRDWQQIESWAGQLKRQLRIAA